MHPTMPIHRFSKCRSLTLRICDCPHSPQIVGWIGTAYFDHLRFINELLGLWSQSTSKIMHRVKHVVKVCPGLSNRWKVITETMLKLSLNTPVYGIENTCLRVEQGWIWDCGHEWQAMSLSTRLSNSECCKPILDALNVGMTNATLHKWLWHCV